MKILVTKEEMKGILRIIADRSFVLTCGMVFALVSLQTAHFKGV